MPPDMVHSLVFVGVRGVEIAGREVDRGRAGSALGTGLVHGLLGAALIWGLDAPLPAALEAPLKLFDVTPPPPEPEPPPVRPPPRVESDTQAQRFAPGEEGGASAPNIRSRATDIVAPPPEVRLPVPSPVVAAPKPAAGSDF